MPLDHDHRTYTSVTASSYDAGKTRVVYDRDHDELNIWLANGVLVALGVGCARELQLGLDDALRARDGTGT